MKRQSLFLLFFIIFPPKVFADTIITGNASAKSTVNTTIEGGGSVTTHIDVEANGKKKTLDSNQPGSYNVEVKSNGSSSSVQTSTDSSHSANPTASATAKFKEKIEQIKKKQESVATLVEDIIKNIFNRIKNLFRF